MVEVDQLELLVDVLDVLVAEVGHFDLANEVEEVLFVDEQDVVDQPAALEAFWG